VSVHSNGVNVDTRKPFQFTTSWDDGTIDDLRLAELLTKYDLPATFYIARKHQYGSLSEKDTAELGRYFEIGAHTLNHVVLSSASKQLASDEIRGSKSWIEQVTGRPCQMFCFPRGKFHKRQLSVVKNAGFAGVRTVELMSLGPPAFLAGIRLMPTTIQCFPHGYSGYLRNIISRRKLGNIRNYLSVANIKNWTSQARSLLIRAHRDGGVFHLWGHAWEIEQQGLWPQLEEVFRTAAEYRSEAIYVRNGELCSPARTELMSSKRILRDAI
jgi:peptidoglycan-N-acetylglucosamine deacetylase